MNKTEKKNLLCRIYILFIFFSFISSMLRDLSYRKKELNDTFKKRSIFIFPIGKIPNEKSIS